MTGGDLDSTVTEAADSRFHVSKAVVFLIEIR